MQMNTMNRQSGSTVQSTGSMYARNDQASVVTNQPTRRKRPRETCLSSSASAVYPYSQTTKVSSFCSSTSILLNGVSKTGSLTTVLLLLVTAGTSFFTPTPTYAFTANSIGHIIHPRATTSPSTISSTNQQPLKSMKRGTSIFTSSLQSKTRGAELVEPKASISPEKREAAVRSIRREELALDGIDPSLLEMLSEEFLFPSALSSDNVLTDDGPIASTGGEEYEVLEPDFGPPPSSTRPFGRPRMVAGAMRRDTEMKYKKRRNLVKYIQQTSATVAENLSSGTESSSSTMDVTSDSDLQSTTTSKNAKSMIDGLESRIHVKSREIARKKRRLAAQKRALANKSAAVSVDLPTQDDTKGLTDSSSTTTTQKKRRRVHKNLPKRKEENYIQQDGQPLDPTNINNLDDSYKNLMLRNGSSSKARRKTGKTTGTLEFRQYYQTQLLTPEQEFELGHKIQIVVQCDSVHEGLARRDGKLPSIQEWASACGFTDEDPNFDETHLKNTRKIRPNGAETMFDQTNPNHFVGNGLAHTMGVGSGRGRPKKPPPTSLGKIFEIDTKTGQRMKGSTTPINRGTVSDFVELMMDGRNAKERMIQANMRLVVSICKKYCKVGVSLHDLVQEGSVGLARAADKYDPSKGFKFSTYASWWIQQAVFRSIAYHSRTIRLPVHIHNMLNRIRKVRNNLQLGLDRAPTDEEMADALDMTPSKYKRMMLLTRRSISLELPKFQQNPKNLFSEGEDSIADMTSLSASRQSSFGEATSPEETVQRSLFHKDLKGMLKMLSKEERIVISLRYGLADGLTRTVTSVAAQLKQTPAVVRSHESKALRKLRRPWYEKKLDEHRQSLLG